MDAIPSVFVHCVVHRESETDCENQSRRCWCGAYKSMQNPLGQCRSPQDVNNQRDFIGCGKFPKSVDNGLEMEKLGKVKDVPFYFIKFR